MPINFMPNDPKANGAQMRRKTPRSERGATVAGFTYVAHAPPALHPLGDPEFLFWQSREAAIAALETYEALAGQPVRQWARSSPARKLDLNPNEGVDLNAYYNGQSLSFFAYTTGSKTTWSGASTDVVAHEAGHALLDQSRPDLWDTTYTETNAFHEAFGDCLAVLTAFSDAGTRTAVRKKLGKSNFVEATAEDLSDGVLRALGAGHGAAKPRHARNTFQWALPTTLPASGPPHVLSAEIHSFARIFTGCFYDTILNILRSRIGKKTPTAAQLAAAVRTAGALLVRAAAEAPETPRFFQSVGRAMVLADTVMNGGANHSAIRDAFQKHNILLGSSAMLAPSAALEGKAPKLGKSSGRGMLGASAMTDLRKRLGAAPKDQVQVAPHEIAGHKMLRAVHLRHVSLGKLDKRLLGVVAVAPEPVLVGAVHKSAAILGELPEATASESEVSKFVETLLASGRIAFDATSSRTGIKAAKKSDHRKRLPTHAIHKEGSAKVLRRVRYAC